MLELNHVKHVDQQSENLDLEKKRIKTKGYVNNYTR